jgi:GDP-mannose pyrophosphatase NudK
MTNEQLFRGKTPNSNDKTAPVGRVRILHVQTLSNDWFVLKKTKLQFLRRDGNWQEFSRETYDRGNGAVLLLFNQRKNTVILTRQFRFPAFVNGCADGMLIEACAGLLDGETPEACIQREAEEETGFHIEKPRKLFEAFMSPGSVTEKLHFFAAEYSDYQHRAKGGGNRAEGEDIEVLELELTQALSMIQSGQIEDGKTIMLLQHAVIVGLETLCNLNEM